MPSDFYISFSPNCSHFKDYSSSLQTQNSHCKLICIRKTFPLCSKQLSPSAWMVLEEKDLRLQCRYQNYWDQKVLPWLVLPWFSLLQETLHILFHGGSENMCYTFFTEKNANTSSSTTEEPSGRWVLHCKLAHLWVALSLYRSASASWLLRQQHHQLSEGLWKLSPHLILVVGFILKPGNSTGWQCFTALEITCFLLSTMVLKMNNFADLSNRKLQRTLLIPICCWPT